MGLTVPTSGSESGNKSKTVLDQSKGRWDVNSPNETIWSWRTGNRWRRGREHSSEHVKRRYSIFECEMPPKGSCIWMLGHQLVVLFEKAVEHLRGGALLKEVAPWGKVLSLHNLSPLRFILRSQIVNIIWPPISATMPSSQGGQDGWTINQE